MGRVKGDLRSSTGQERLSMLTCMSIEHELLRSLDFTDTIEESALAKARKTAICNRPIKLRRGILSESGAVLQSTDTYAKLIWFCLVCKTMLFSDNFRNYFSSLDWRNCLKFASVMSHDSHDNCYNYFFSSNLTVQTFAVDGRPYFA